MRGDKNEVSIGSDNKALPSNCFLSSESPSLVPPGPLALRFSSGETTEVVAVALLPTPVADERRLEASFKIREASSLPRAMTNASASARGEHDSSRNGSVLADSVFAIDAVISGCDGEAVDAFVSDMSIEFDEFMYDNALFVILDYPFRCQRFSCQLESNDTVL
jgi:hypothetical protein